MQKDFAPISRIFYLLLSIVGIYVLTQLAYGWSLNETTDFARAIVGDEYAKSASWAIQLLPQILLLFTAYFSVKDKHYGRNVKFIVLVALGINAIDAITNFGALAVWFEEPGVVEYIAGLPEMVQQMTHLVGYLFAFGITWAEEIMLFIVALALNLVVDTAKDYGWEVPAWFRLDAVSATARRASGATTAQEMLGDSDNPSPPASRPTRRRTSRIRQRPPAPRGNTMRGATAVSSQSTEGMTTTITPTSEPGEF